jgi:hypothetical protein
MESDWNSKTVKELKEIAKKRGLKQTGNKEELIRRIQVEESSKPKPPVRSKSPSRPLEQPTYFDILPQDIKNQGVRTYPKKEIVPGTHLPNLVIKFPFLEILQ